MQVITHRHRTHAVAVWSTEGGVWVINASATSAGHWHICRSATANPPGAI